MRSIVPLRSIRGRAWKRPKGWNCFDERPCPVCGCMVNGDKGQETHEDYHVELDAFVESVHQFMADMTPEGTEIGPGKPGVWTWHAAVSAPGDEVDTR